MVTRICAPGSLTRTNAALPSSQPSSRNVLMLTAPDRPAGDCVMRTLGSPVSPSGSGLPGAGNTQKTPVSSVIKWPETRSSDMRPKAGSSEGVRAGRHRRWRNASVPQWRLRTCATLALYGGLALRQLHGDLKSIGRRNSLRWIWIRRTDLRGRKLTGHPGNKCIVYSTGRCMRW